MAPAKPESPSSLLTLAEELFGQTYLLTRQLKEASQPEPSLSPGASHTALWSEDSEFEQARSRIFGLTKELTKLLHGPHSYLHELISSNWELGALYTVLEHGLLEAIPLDGEANLSQLAEKSGIPERKLQNILRLVSCEGILEESSNGVFRHTAISEELVTDQKFKSFVGFQLYETRISSAHIADTLKLQANDFHNGQSAFKYAWGSPMYDWHKTHPEKGARFQRAMQGVTQTLDPGNTLFDDFFTAHAARNPTRTHIIDVLGKTGATPLHLAQSLPNLTFTVQENSAALIASARDSLPTDLRSRIDFEERQDLFDAPQSLTPYGRGSGGGGGDITVGGGIETGGPTPVKPGKVLAFTIRNILWNLPDTDCLKLLRTFVPALKQDKGCVLVVNEMCSPARGEFEPHVELGYRRRDVTVMAMHNAKQRDEGEWRELFGEVDGNADVGGVDGNADTDEGREKGGLQVVDMRKAWTSHSYRALWVHRWVEPGAGVNGVNGHVNGMVNGHLNGDFHVVNGC
ncbi:MAG: hypothetical protein M1831_006861 [Alyxoria varia]|nr:MAG: hypothetical protein M1831_006861 [Alyxoria varia]